MDSQVRGEIESESSTEFPEDYGMMEDVPADSKDRTINPIDGYRYFITDNIISLMVRETNQYAEQHVQRQKLTKRSKALQWNKSNLFGFEVIQNTTSRDRVELVLKFLHFSNNQEEHAD